MKNMYLDLYQNECEYSQISEIGLGNVDNYRSYVYMVNNEYYVVKFKLCNMIDYPNLYKDINKIYYSGYEKSDTKYGLVSIRLFKLDSDNQEFNIEESNLRKILSKYKYIINQYIKLFKRTYSYYLFDSDQNINEQIISELLPSNFIKYTINNRIYFYKRHYMYRTSPPRYSNFGILRYIMNNEKYNPIECDYKWICYYEPYFRYHNRGFDGVAYSYTYQVNGIDYVADFCKIDKLSFDTLKNLLNERLVNYHIKVNCMTINLNLLRRFDKLYIINGHTDEYSDECLGLVDDTRKNEIIGKFRYIINNIIFENPEIHVYIFRNIHIYNNEFMPEIFEKIIMNNDTYFVYKSALNDDSETWRFDNLNPLIYL